MCCPLMTSAFQAGRPECCGDEKTSRVAPLACAHSTGRRAWFNGDGDETCFDKGLGADQTASEVIHFGVYDDS